MTKSRILLYFCLSFIGGIFLNSFFPFLKIFLFQFSFLCIIIILILFIRKPKELLFFASCFLLFSFGISRHQSFLLEAENNGLKPSIKKEISLIGIVDSQPALGEKSTKLELRVENIKARVLITSFKYPQYKYGDKLKIKGILEEPQVFEDFSYKDYLAKDGIYAVMYFPKIELISRGLGNPFMSSIFSFKDKLKEVVARIMPSPQAGLLEALFFGDEENIPEHWKEKFNLTGTRHITAVSGMNITIISILILNFLLFLGFWRNQAFYISIILILFYVLVIGAPASAVRAGIMGVLLLTAQHFGRISSGLRIIVFSACLMLFFNPLLLKADIGFQLSFLAILGLVYLQPIFLDLFKKIPNVFELRYTLSATLAAQFFALPVLIYNFGQIPLVGPLANIFIVPLLTLITILGFILAFLGLIYLPLGRIIFFPVWLVLTYILKIIDFSSKIPHATLALQNVPFVFVLISYLILGFITWRLQEDQKLKFLN